uniref:RNase_PH domain-containing protein n=1 Tax=Panagrellus redivivus TaxID=6233 RepID=A0A7E4WBM1_PANRE
MADDIFVASDASVNSSSDDELPRMSELPDNVGHRFAKKILDLPDEVALEEEKDRKLKIKIHRCSDRVCGYGTFGNTRICCVVLTPVNEADAEDFEAGVTVSITGAAYVSKIAMRDIISYMIPSAKLKRTFIDIRFSVYSDSGCVIPTALSTAMLTLSASKIDVKGVVTAATVLVNPQGELTVSPGRVLEEKVRDKTPGFGYVTAVKIMRDPHVRWYDTEGLVRRKQFEAAMSKACEEATNAYDHMASMLQHLAANSSADEVHCG